jgi:hypothetical protein
MDKDEIKAVLQDPSTDWHTHDLGMIFADLEGRGSIHVWDAALKSADPPLHTHPWHIDSTVVVGEITNTRYAVDCCAGRDYHTAESHWANRPHSLAGRFPIGDTTGAKLVSAPPETYKAGESYHQDAAEIHASAAVDGTVTLVRKVFAGRQASRLYFQGDYKPMEMRIATPAESAHAVGLALALF